VNDAALELLVAGAAAVVALAIAAYGLTHPEYPEPVAPRLRWDGGDQAHQWRIAARTGYKSRTWMPLDT
jgi:hypothetical protein